MWREDLLTRDPPEGRLAGGRGSGIERGGGRGAEGHGGPPR